MTKFKFILEDDYDDDKVKKVRLALRPSKSTSGGVDLVTLTEDGKDTKLFVLTINPDGTFYRHHGGNFDTGSAYQKNPHNKIAEA